MSAMDWLTNKPWFELASTLRAYKGMIFRGDPDSSDADPFRLASSTSNPNSHQDQVRESHRGTEVADLSEAQVLTSESLANPFLHKVLLDIDVPAMLIPSTTPGHSHLLIDVQVPWEKYVDMMDAMAEAGVLEVGFVKAARARGFSTLRMPWVKKEEAPKRNRPGKNQRLYAAQQAMYGEEFRAEHNIPARPGAAYVPLEDTRCVWPETAMTPIGPTVTPEQFHRALHQHIENRTVAEVQAEIEQELIQSYEGPF